MLGGGLLVSNTLEPLLSPEQHADPKIRGKARLSTEVREVRTKDRVRRTASSAEAIRAMKRSMGVPCRPTTKPVDVWSRN